MQNNISWAQIEDGDDVNLKSSQRQSLTKTIRRKKRDIYTRKSLRQRSERHSENDKKHKAGPNSRPIPVRVY